MTPTLSARFIPAAVVIDGYAARALAIMLRRDWDRGDFRSLPPEGRSEAYHAVRALERAGEAWMRSRPSVGGRAETAVVEIGSESSHEQFISVDTAAGLLGVSDRRVRQLAAAGLGAKVGGSWVIRRSDVELEAARRVSAA